MGIKIGDKVGSYRVLRPLGQGGMGTVFEVEHERLGVHFALKAFTLADGDRAFFRKRFFAEGRILARLDDPHVVRVVDLDVEPQSDTPYFVMDLVQGPDGTPQTLAEVAAAERISDRQLQIWYEDLRAALEAVHAAGVVHRDIKPENVLIDARRHVRLTDFGICRVVDESLRSQLEVSRTMNVASSEELRTVLGTVNYLSPEVRAGAEPGVADDCYALGVMLFRLLTGVWYAPGTNVMDLLRPFDSRWKRIFAALLAVDPQQRHMPPLQGKAPARTSRLRWAVPLGLVASLALGAVAFLSVSEEKDDFSYVDDMFYIPRLAP